MDSANFRDLSLAEIDTKTLLSHASEQAIQRRYEDFLIVDVDGHHFENQSYAEICEYIEDPGDARLRPSTRASAAAASPRRLRRLQESRPAAHALGSAGYPKEKTPPDDASRHHPDQRWMDAIGVDSAALPDADAATSADAPAPTSKSRWRAPITAGCASSAAARAAHQLDALSAVQRSPTPVPRWSRISPAKRASRLHDRLDPPQGRARQRLHEDLCAMLEERGLPLVVPRRLHLGGTDRSKLCNRFIAVHALGFIWFNILHCTNWL